MTEKQKKLIGILVIIAVIVFMVAVFWFAGIPMIQFVEDPAQYRAWIDGKGLWAQISFVAMVLFQVVIAIIPGEPLEICAGYAFGAVEGSLLCMIGIGLGSAVIFLLVRSLGIRLLEVFFPVEKIRSIGFLKNSRKRNSLAFILMLVPGTPKDLISYFAGLTKMTLPEWLIISTIARIPSILTSTMGGNALAQKEYGFAIWVFVITAALSIAGIVVYNKLGQKKDPANE